MSKLNVLVLASHPDDETLGCGSTIARLANEGYDISLLTFTNGIGARDATLSSRAAVLSEVIKVLGIKEYLSNDLPDNAMDTVSLLSVIKWIEDFIKHKKFDMIFTHTPECLNIDHRIIYQATITAFRPITYYPHSIYCYAIPSSTDFNPLNKFQPNTYFVGTEASYHRKLDALKLYYSGELWKSPSARSIIQIANHMKLTGGEVSTWYAEKFQLVRQVK